MIRHTVMFRWTPNWTNDQRVAVENALGELPGVVPTIRSYHFGSDIGVNEGNFDFVVVADFDDVEGFLVYRDHPDGNPGMLAQVAQIREILIGNRLFYPAGFNQT